MKNLMLSILIGTSLVGCATTSTTAVKVAPLTQISETIDIENTSKEVIFERSKIWMAKSFKSANNVIQYADKDTGSIIGKGNIQYPCSGFIDCEAFGKDVVNFTIKIDTKDSKARLTFSDLTRKSLTRYVNGITFPGGDFPIIQQKQQEQVEVKLRQIISGYKTDIVSQQADSNW